MLPAATHAAKTTVSGMVRVLKAGESTSAKLRVHDRFGNARWSGGDLVRLMVLQTSAVTDASSTIQSAIHRTSSMMGTSPPHTRASPRTSSPRHPSSPHLAASPQLAASPSLRAGEAYRTRGEEQRLATRAASYTTKRRAQPHQSDYSRPHHSQPHDEPSSPPPPSVKEGENGEEGESEWEEEEEEEEEDAEDSAEEGANQWFETENPDLNPNPNPDLNPNPNPDLNPNLQLKDVQASGLRQTPRTPLCRAWLSAAG